MKTKIPVHRASTQIERSETNPSVKHAFEEIFTQVSCGGLGVVLGAEDVASTGIRCMAMETSSSTNKRLVIFGGDNGVVYIVTSDENGKILDQKEVTVTVAHAADKWSGVECIAFQPNTGREVVFVGTNEGMSAGGTIVAISTSKAEILYKLEGHKKTVTNIAATADGNKIVSVSYDKTAKIWDVNRQTGPKLQPITEVMEKDKLYIRSVAISPNSEVFCLGGGDSRTGFIHIYDMNEPYNHLLDLVGHKETVRCLEFSKDKRTLFSGSSAKTIKVWDLSLTPTSTESKSVSVTVTASGRLRKTLIGHTDFVNCLSESPCEKFLCSGSNDGTIKIWDVLAGVELRELKVNANVCGVCYMEHHDIKAASADGQIRVFNLSASSRPNLTFLGHKAEVTAISISKDGSTLVSSSLDDTVRVWDAKGDKGEKDALTLKGHDFYVICVDISSDARLALSGSYDDHIIIWDLNSKYEEKKIKKGDETWAKRDQKFHLGTILNINEDGTYQIQFEDNNTKENVALEDINLFMKNKINFGNRVRYKVETGEILMEFKGHTDRVSALEPTSDGKHLVTGSWDHSIIVWELPEGSGEVKNGKIVRRLEGHSDYVKSITLDDSFILSGSADNLAKVWDLSSGELLHTFQGHQGAVNSVAIHPSGDFIATGSFDNTWKLWNFQPPYNLLYTSTDTHKDHINSVVFTHGGDNLVTGADDKTVSVADIAPHLHQLPSSVHTKTFDRDCEKENDAHRFEWADTDTMKIIQHRPSAPFEPHYNADTNRNEGDMQQNLVHKAASAGASKFLSECLFVSDDGTEDLEIKGKMRGIVGYKPSGWRSRQQRAIMSTVQEDLNGETPLKLATHAQGGGGSAVKVLLECYALLFSQAYAPPFYNYNINNDQHPSTLFPLDEFIETLDKFPASALTFLGQLSLISPEDHSVQRWVDRHAVGPIENGEVLEGSCVRIVGPDEKPFKRKLPSRYESYKRKMVPITAKFVPIYKIASADSKFLHSVVDACSLIKKYNVFENEVVQTVVEHKWKRYVRKMFFFDFFLYTLLVTFLTVDSLVYRSAISSDQVFVKVVGLFPMFAASCIWVHFAYHEFAQCQSGVSFYKHISNFWNILDFLSLSSIFCAYTFRVLEWVFGTVTAAEVAGNLSPDSIFYWSTLSMSFSLPVTYLNLLYFMQGFHESGQLVRMIIGIIKGIRVFLALLAICMVGFAAGFFILFEGEKDNRQPLMHLFKSYTLMLGDFDIDDFTTSVSYVSIATLFIAFTVFINIIMLNLLIAIMGDIFDRIQENARAEFMFARARIILEFEETLSEEQKKNAEWFPEWLQVLVPTLQDNDLDNEWVGRLKSLKNTVTQAKQEMNEVLHENERKRQISERQRIESEASHRASERRLDAEIRILNEKLDKETKQRRGAEREAEEMLRSICEKIGVGNEL
ncbi:hypothetical protein TL16_g03675 [Triparma laevis f. inornata]|uniref:Ion transport domain-containing protein n=1 Tax=Triparma laevis f. inornata TaxID=1714386 RepID=A0A9W7A7G4_9STRA|nr:hypothetical protein TL16_g03675 [Triparma laevis f. inornata]